MDIKKNDELILTIDDMGKDGEGIGRVDGYALFVRGALTGETVRVVVMKTKKQYGFARLIEGLEPSSHRLTPLCPVAGPCGGCTLQHMDYAGQLAFKEKKVRDCLTRIAGVDPGQVEWLPILGMDDNVGDLAKGGQPVGPWHYRNKAQFPVRRGEDGLPVTGFFAGHSHRLVSTAECRIQHPVINETVDVIMNFLRQYRVSAYDEDKHEGLVRHIYVRRGYHSGQVMVCLVINGFSLPSEPELVEALQLVEGMTSIYINSNTERTNVILGAKMKLIWGDAAIEDRIGDVRYRISPQSFYQVNPMQTEKLYRTALEFADLQGGETVWDLYCGIGTISLFLASQVSPEKGGRVIGVEIVPEAVENAKVNAELNGIANAEFFCGAAEEVAASLIPEEEMQADVVVVDPPRKGCDGKLLDTIAGMRPEKIVYVSCDPATLARDVKVLGEKGYEVKRVRACDMFPQGGHVETVVLLSKHKNTKHITIDLQLDELDVTSAEAKPTYPKIKKYIMDKYGVKLHSKDIAETKRKYGLIERKNYNISKKEHPIVRHCTKEKEKLIVEALKHYKAI